MKQYKIAARNAWDIVEIGPFNSFNEAKAMLKWNWSKSLIKEIKQGTQKTTE